MLHSVNVSTNVPTGDTNYLLTFKGYHMNFEVTANVLNIRFGVVGDESQGEVKRPWGKILMLEDNNTTEKEGFFGRDVREWRLSNDNDNALAKQIKNQIQLPCNLKLSVELRKVGGNDAPFVTKVEVIK
jgi:hypothetical protein